VPSEPVLAGERKTVTVLFCDLVGSTARADGADPEDVQASLAAYQGLVRGVLERHGAAVEKFIGDAVMAVFGAPVAHEDDAERAVRAGLAILATVGQANQTRGLGLAVRIGVATDEVLVNLEARPERGETLVAGDLVNTAARLQTSADPGTVVAGERTYQLTRNQLVYAPLPDAVVKGKAAPLQRWQATGARSDHGTEAGVRSATRFVGRGAEIAALQAAYERVVAGPALELVLVTGEPGVGKSRLVAEFFTWVDQRAELVRWRQGRCLPYGDQVTFYALAQIVKAEAGILDSDDVETARGKLTHAVAALTELDEQDRAWVTARLAPLAGLAGEGGAGEGERFTAWRRFLEALAAEAPLVLVVEDAHWADAQLLAFLGHLAEYSEGRPVLLVVTARPELATGAPDFGAEARAATRLDIRPLDDADTAALLAGLLDAPLLDAGLQSALLERAGGNPLFAEQVVHLLTEQGAVRRRGNTVTLTTSGELPVPGSLAALITARLDTLPRTDGALLRDAAVIGRIFWSGAVAALSGSSEDQVRARLRALARAGFVARLPRSSIAAQAEYRFTHALVRDAAYHALPRPVRGTRHLAAAGWLETHAGDRGADTAEVVAYHAVTAFELAHARGDQQAADSLRSQTARRLTAAADRVKALDLGATERHYTHAAAIIAPGDPARAGLLCKWADASWAAGKFEQAQQLAEEALTLAQARHDTLHTASAMFRLGALASNRGDYAESERRVTSAAALLETLPPGEDLLEAYRHMALSHGLAGRAADSLALCNRVLDLAPAGSPWKIRTLTWRSWARAMLGDPAFLEDDHEAIRLARQHPLDAPYVLEDTLCQAGEDFWLADGPKAALTVYQESQEIARRKGVTLVAVGAEASSLAPMFDLGHWDELLATASALRPRLQAMGETPRRLEMEPFPAAVLCWRGSLAQAHQILGPVLPQARQMALQELLPTLAVAITLSLADGNATETLHLVEEYERALAPAAPASWYWGWTHLAGIVRACAALGELDRARRLADAAEPMVRRHRLQVQTAKAVIAEAADDPAAEQLYAEAASGWKEYGHVLEHGLALLGLGRCRHRAGHPDSTSPLLAARAIVARLRAPAPLAEADRLLGGQLQQTS
jgi:class 3 adenylate cyclase/tetratricopeptide (TPR) repeat protein